MGRRVSIETQRRVKAARAKLDSERFTIVSVEAIAAKAPVTALALGGAQVCGSPAGVKAVVETTSDLGASSSGAAFADGRVITLGLSKLDGEAEWIVDSLTVGSYPVFANGVGARYCLLKTLRDTALIVALDAAAAGVVA